MKRNSYYNFNENYEFDNYNYRDDIPSDDLDDGLLLAEDGIIVYNDDMFYESEI